MRPLPILSAVLLVMATQAYAQVTLDLHALQALPERGGASATPRTFQRQTRPPASQPPLAATQPPAGSLPTTVPSANAPLVANAPSAIASSPARAPSSAATTPSAAGPPATAANGPANSPPPTLPQAPPAVASIQPLAPPPPSAASAPPAPVISDKAATNAEPTGSGLRVTFAPGQSDLSPESVDRIKRLAADAPTGDTVSFNVLAYAPGSPDDPSTARRVSLSRAMAVRSALIGDGVPSPRIYVRALGAQYGDGPHDRVDVNVLGATAGNDAAPAAAR